MLETFILSFTAFFATVGPIDVAIVYAALTGRVTTAAKKSMAIRGVAVAALILFSFAVFGQMLLDNLGISLAALPEPTTALNTRTICRRWPGLGPS